MGAALPTIAAIGSLISGAAAVVSTFKTPKISIPEVKIPGPDLQAINTAIEANKGLSDTARQTVQQAITMYQQGQLTPQYQAKLDEWWKQASKQLTQRFAAAGLSDSSMFQTAYFELQQKYLNTYGDLLRAQLNDALSLAGLADSYREQLMQKAQLQLQGSLAQANNLLAAHQYAAQTAAARGQAFGSLSSAFGQLGQFGNVFGQTKQSVFGQTKRAEDKAPSA